ncbi:hypothetical protein ACFFLM_08295 [Deinococcus oregonensis]|uniref:DUF2059 domain-containing protein n=1 Tax=Deinococcus oregonensis TaxID=1805970 RepID=A0ABV6B0L0_9DEIO
MNPLSSCSVHPSRRVASLALMTLLGTSPALAQTGSITLSEYEPTFKLLGLMANTTFSAREKAAVVASYRRELAQIRKNLKANAATLTQVQGMKNPVARSEQLRQYFVGAYWNHLKRPDPGYALMFKHRPVVAADPQTRFVSTAADIEALFDNNDFVARLAGLKASTAAERTSGARDLIKTFKTLGEGSQRRLNYALTYRLAITQAWKGGTPQLRSAMTDFARYAVKAQDGLPTGTSTFELVTYRSWFPEKTPAAGNSSMAEITQANNEIFRLGYLADQFTRLSSR